MGRANSRPHRERYRESSTGNESRRLPGNQCCLHSTSAEIFATAGFASGSATCLKPLELIVLMIQPPGTKKSKNLGLIAYRIQFTSECGRSNCDSGARLREPLMEDVQQGWVVVTNIHNHNFFPLAERVLGGVVPSATDIQYLRNVRRSLGVTRAVIIN